MGLLDKLWDDTLAGPCPDSGLGKLRNITITNPAITPEVRVSFRRSRERRASAKFQRSDNEAIQVTRSITSIKPPGSFRSLSMDGTSSLAGSTPQISTSSLTPREGDQNPWQSHKHKKGSEKSLRAEPRSPTVYDWVIFSFIDR